MNIMKPFGEQVVLTRVMVAHNNEERFTCTSIVLRFARSSRADATMSLSKILEQLHADRRGAVQAEYTIVLMLVVVSCIGAMLTLGTYVLVFYDQFEIFSALPLP
jgi:Flp pilus assembly pilin Flp